MACDGWGEVCGAAMRRQLKLGFVDSSVRRDRIIYIYVHSAEY